MRGISRPGENQAVDSVSQQFELVTYMYLPLTARRRFINEKQCLHVPSLNGNPAAWATSLTCMWDAPPGTLCKYSLKDILAQSFGALQMDRVSRFFQHVLRVPDAACEDIIEELQRMRDDARDDFDRISMLYECIAAKSNADVEIQRYVRSVSFRV